MSHKIKTSVEVDGYLSADHLKISTSSAEPVNVGEIVWNQIDGTFDMGLIGGVTLQAGQEMHMYGKATESISDGNAVMFAGVQGDHILIAKADAATINNNPEYFIGIATQNFSTNDFGYITVFGNVRGLNTTSYTLGTVLYYNSASSTDGLLTSTAPTAPNAKIEVAAVVRVHATQGILLVRPHVMPKVKDLQDVYAPSASNNDGLFWNTSNNRYESKSIVSALGYTPVPTTRTITINGSTQDLSANRTFNIDTGVTSFNTRTGAITLTSGDVTGALGYTPYNASNPAGYISSYTETDPTVPSHVKSITTTEKSNWNTAFSWGNHASAGYVPQARTITINGVSQDLSANRSFTVSSTVTSGFSLVNQGTASNTPSSPTANMGVFVDTYAFIDLATAHPDGGWIDFSKANGTDYAGRIRYNNTSDYFSISAGSNEQVRIFNSNAEALGSFRSPIFYDSNNTGYYVDPASTSNLYDLTLTGGKHTYLYINPGNGYEAMVRYNGGSGNTWYAGKRTTSTTQAGTADFHFYSDAAGDTVFGIGADGTIKAKGDVVAYSSSDKELKDNILPIQNALEKVKQIGGYTFDWNDKQIIHKGHDVGVIAQEIESVLPEVVITRDTGFKAVKYEKIVPLLIEAIKEQQTQIEELKQLIKK